MFTKRFAVSLAALLFSVALAAPASASYVTADGLEFSFFNLGTVADLVGGDDDTYAIKVEVDSTNYTGSATDYLEGIQIKVGDYDAATGTTTAPGTWTFVTGELSAGGCIDNSSPGLCRESSSDNAYLDGSTYVFIFNVDVTTELDDQIHLKALWLDEDDKKVGGMISLDFDYDDTDVEIDTHVIDVDLDVPVPEPGSLLLLGSGLVAAAARFRRRTK